MRLLQLSDPHLLAAPEGLVRGRRPLAQLGQGLDSALAELAAPPDLLLITGDLCHDESLGGYVRLRDLLAPLAWPVALLAGNHDHPQLLRAALGRRAWVAPRLVELGEVALLLLNSHRPGCVGGWLGERQLAWIAQVVDHLGDRPLLVAVHHPPWRSVIRAWMPSPCTTARPCWTCCGRCRCCRPCCSAMGTSTGRRCCPVVRRRCRRRCCWAAPPPSAASGRCSPAPWGAR